MIGLNNMAQMPLVNETGTFGDPGGPGAPVPLAPVKFDPQDLVVHHKRMKLRRMNFSLNQIRLFILVVSKIQPEAEQLSEVSFTVAEMKRVMGLEKHITVEEIARDILHPLLSLRISQNEISPRSGLKSRLKITNLFACAEYRREEGLIVVGLNPKTAPLFLGLGRDRDYVHHELGVLLHLQSVYSVRLFLLLKQYEGQPAGKTFALQELRDILGIPAGEYLKIHHFHSRVIGRAVEEFAEKTPLVLRAEPVKEGRAIAAYHFTVMPKGHPSLPKPKRKPRAAAINSSAQIELPLN